MIDVEAEIRESLGIAAPVANTRGWMFRVAHPRSQGLSFVGKAVMHFFRAGKSLCGTFAASPADIYREHPITGIPNCATCLDRLQELPL